MVTIDLSRSPVEQLQRVVIGVFVIAAHAVRRFQVEPPGEDGQPHEQCLLGIGEQPVGPVDRRGETLLPRQRIACPTAEESQPVQAARNVEAAHRPHPGRGQFDRQWQAVEPPADLGDGADRFLVEIEVRPAGPRPHRRKASWRRQPAAA